MPIDSFPVLMFAAGFGTRMKHLTQDRPKPLIEVAGQPLIDHALTMAQAAGCAPIAANLHYKAQMLADHLSPKGVACINEDPDILETGGGLKNALPTLGKGPVVTMNTDAVWTGTNPISALMAQWVPTRMDALLMCVPPDRAAGHSGDGDFRRAADGRLTRGPGLIYGGVQILKTEMLAQIAETAFSLNVLWDQMLTEGRLCGLVHDGRWCDVGHPAGIRLAEELLKTSDV